MTRDDVNRMAFNCFVWFARNGRVRQVWKRREVAGEGYRMMQTSQRYDEVPCSAFNPADAFPDKASAIGRAREQIAEMREQADALERELDAMAGPAVAVREQHDEDPERWDGMS